METLPSKTARPWNWNEFKQYDVTKTPTAKRYELFVNYRVKKERYHVHHNSMTIYPGLHEFLNLFAAEQCKYR